MFIYITLIIATYFFNTCLWFMMLLSNDKPNDAAPTKTEMDEDGVHTYQGLHISH
jgi:hypothetical protein